MIEIRWHGRGGQGAFTAARLLGQAASIYDGHFAQAFPSFGPERRGAPVLAFTRIDESKILDRSMVEECDHVVVLDDTLFGEAVTRGLKPGGKIFINSTQPAESFQQPDGSVVVLDATDLALKVLGRDVTNVPMLAALAAGTGVTGKQALMGAIDDQLGPKIRAKNKELLEQAFNQVQAGLAGRANA